MSQVVDRLLKLGNFYLSIDTGIFVRLDSFLLVYKVDSGLLDYFLISIILIRLRYKREGRAKTRPERSVGIYPRAKEFTAFSYIKHNIKVFWSQAFIGLIPILLRYLR
jgi:hypothetical protein